MLLALCSCGSERDVADEYGAPADYVYGDITSSLAGKASPDGEGEPGSLSTKAVSDFYYSMDEKEMISGYFDVPSIAVEPGTGSDVPYEPAQTAPGTLTAGRWNDNNNYDFWKSVLNRNDWYAIAEKWSLFASHRVAFRVTSTAGRFIKGATVTAFDKDGKQLGSAVTDSYGMAYVYYDVKLGNSETVPATYSYVFTRDTEYTGSGEIADPSAVTDISVTFNGVLGAKKLDLMFVIDTTGSMGDELRYIQTELNDVIAKVKDRFEQGVSIRLSVNFYRDHGDTYVVSSNKFTADISEAIAALAKQYSDGGGDYPEAVDEALENAVKDHDWDDDAVKLMFFVLDAPPHNDRKGTPERIYENVLLAAEQGIRIIPVASSGVNTETELIMRSLAAITGGTYVFLTNDSGIGGDHLEPTIGDYEVEKLNDLMVDLITKYLAELNAFDPSETK